MKEFDAFEKLQEIEEQLSEALGYTESRMRRDSSRKIPTEVTVKEATSIIVALQGALRFERQRADRAEAQVADLKTELLEKEFIDFKSNVKGTGKTQKGSDDQNIRTFLAIIRRHYSKKFHPDRIGKNKIMTEVNRAVDFLENPEAKKY